MRIAVIGAGAVGGYFGGRLARAGEDVVFLVRGDTLLALREGGLSVESPTEPFSLPAVQATDDPSEVGVVDVVLHTTKARGLLPALDHARPLIGPDTVVVTTQNGVEAPALVAGLVGERRVVPGIVRIFARQVSPGVVEHMGGPGSLTLATADGRPSQPLELFRDALGRAGVPSPIVDDIWVELWLKAMYVVPHGGLGAVTGEPLGVLRHPHGLRDTLTAAASEIAAVGLARGVRLPEDAVARCLAFADSQPAGATASLQRDLLDGLPSELDAQIGTICRYGDGAGIPTPLHDLLWRALSTLEGQR